MVDMSDVADGVKDDIHTIDYGEAFLQIAIVLASVAIVTGTGALVLSVMIGRLARSPTACSCLPP